MEEYKKMLDEGTITQEQYDKLLTVHEENVRLRNQITAGSTLRLKVSDKGAVSVYGLGRFPVTLYKSQMLRFLAHAQEIIDFIKANDGKLVDKRDSATAPVQGAENHKAA